MGKIYRVLVVEQDEHGMGSMGGGRVLFEAASGDRGRLLAYAPTEVEAALGGEIGNAIPDRVEPMQLVDLNALKTLGEPMQPDEPEGVQQPAAPPAEPVKRKRRTRAEIEADKAAAELAAQQQANASPLVEGGPVPQVAEAPAPVAVPEPAPPADGKPWNPFEQR